MKNEAIADEILSALQQILEAAGPDWCLQFLQAGLEAAQEGGGEQPMGAPPMETVSRGGPGSMGKIAPMMTGLGGN